jgi:hypothetical protein
LSWRILGSMPSRSLLNGLWIALRILDCRSNCWPSHLLTHLYMASITIFGGCQQPSGLDKSSKVKLVSQIFRASFFYSTRSFCPRHIAPFVSSMHLDWSSIDTRQFQASLNAEMNTCVNITTVGFLGCRRQLFLFLCSAIRGVDSALVGGYGMNDFEGLLNLGPGFRRLSSTNIAADGVSCHIHHVMYITMFKTFTILCRLEHQLSINFASSVIRCKWMFGFEKCSHSYV